MSTRARVRCRCLLVVCLAAAAAGPLSARPRAQAPSSAAQPASPAGPWLKDAQGREYRVERIPKQEAQKVSDTEVRLFGGVTADLAREDERFYYIKLYRTDHIVVAPSEAVPAPVVAVTPADSARFAFVADAAGLPASGQWRDVVVLADLTGDGRPEIVTGPVRKTLRPPNVFVRDAAGTWARWPEARFPARPFDYGAIAVGDVDRSGLPDLVLGVHLRGMMALRATTRGVFEDASRGLDFADRPGDPVFSSRAVALVDCNGDGRLDIAALGEGPRLQMAPGPSGPQLAMGLVTYVQAQDGSWTPRRHELGPSFFGHSIAVGDVDGDGRPDLVTGSAVLGTRDLVHRATGPCTWTSEVVTVVRPRSYTKQVAVGPLDEAAAAEIVVAYADFSGAEPAVGLDVIERTAAGTWTRREILREPGREMFDAVAAGDLDGDGIDEVVAADATGTLHVFVVAGRGFTREQQLIASPIACRASSIALGDVDGDGLRDVVVAYAQESSPMRPGECPSDGGLAAWRTRRATP